MHELSIAESILEAVRKELVSYPEPGQRVLACALENWRRSMWIHSASVSSRWCEVRNGESATGCAALSAAPHLQRLRQGVCSRGIQFALPHVCRVQHHAEQRG